MKSVVVRWLLSLLVLSGFNVGNSLLQAAVSVTVAWDPSPDATVAKYNVYYGPTGGSITNQLPVGKSTSGTVANLAAGQSYFLYVTAASDAGLESPPSNYLTYSPTVAPQAAPPQLTAVPDQSVTAGTQLQVHLSATGTGTLTYSLITGPTGAAVDSATGVFTWTPAQSQAPSTNAVTVQVSDSGAPGSTTRTSFNVVVTVPSQPRVAPTLVSVGGQPWISSSAPGQPLTNGSFEQGLAGWTINGNVSCRWTAPYTASNGTNLLVFNAGQTPPNGVVSQTIATVAGQTYSLNFDAGTLSYNQNEQRLKVTVQGNSALISQTISLFGLGGGAMQWKPQSYTFVADGSSATLSFQDVSPSTDALDLVLDNVRITPQAQSFQSTPNFPVMTGNNLSLPIVATDPSVPASSLCYSIKSGPTGANLDSATGVFTWTPTSAQAAGSVTVTIQVCDNGSPALSDVKSFSVNVIAVNTPPSLAFIPDQTVVVGTPLTLQLTGSDSDVPAQVLFYSLASGPTGATVDPTSGLFSWTPSAAQAGSSVSITVQVTDSGLPSATASRSFKVTATPPNTAPTLAPVPNLLATAGSPITVQLSAADSDVPAQTLTYSLVAGPGSATLNPTTGSFSWSPTSAQAGSAYPVTVRVTDSGSPPLSASQTFTIAVAAPNTAPSLATVANQLVVAGSLLSLKLHGTDSDLPAQSLSYGLVSGPAGAAVDQSSGTFSWTPLQAQAPSTNSITVQVTDSGNPPLSCSRTFVVVVTPSNTPPVLAPIPDQTVSAGQVVMLSLNATDVDAPAQTLTYKLVSGPVGAKVDPRLGVFTWRLSKSAPASINKVTVAVTDSGSPPLTATQTFSIIIANKASGTPQSSPRLARVENVSWTAELDGERSISFVQPVPSDQQPGEWAHYLEASEDLIHWVTVGLVGDSNELLDASARGASKRFYRVRSDAAGAGVMEQQPVVPSSN
jgi:hypothetical protein